jgi:membrane protease YdiL (CAAX protease family)
MSLRTWLLTALLGAMLAVLTYLRIAGVDLPLGRPVDTVVRVQERNLIIDDGLPPRWQRVRAVVAGANQDDRREAVAAFGQVLAALDAAAGTGERKPEISAPANARPALLARLAVVSLESRRPGEAAAPLGRLAAWGAEGRSAAAVIRWAYGLPATAATSTSDGEPAPAPPAPGAGPDPRPDSDLALGAARELMWLPSAPSPSWTVTRLEQRALARRGDGAGADQAAARLRAATATFGGRATRLTVAYYGAVFLGLVCLTAMAIRRRWFQPLADGHPHPPWSLADGWTVAVRGGAATLLASVFLQIVAGGIGLKTLPLVTLLSALPLLFMVWKGLLVPARLELGAAFGLRPSAPALSVIAASLGLIALEQGLAVLVACAARALGHGMPWSESLNENLIFGGPPIVASELLEGVVVAPIVEEIVCRGLIYATLRARFGPWPAALLSSGLFAALHLYEPVGFAILFGGAVVSALVYERTRSLVPSIAGHAVNNAFALLVGPLLYR